MAGAWRSRPWGDSGSIPERAELRRPAEVAERDGLIWLAPVPLRAPLPELAPGAGLGGAGIATVFLPVRLSNDHPRVSASHGPEGW
jgi:hypothetical protein